MDKDQENNTSEKKRGRGAVEEEEADDGDKKRVKVDVVPAKKVEVEVEEKPENVGPKCDCGIVPPREVAKKGKNKGRAYFSCRNCQFYAFEVRTASCF